MEFPDDENGHALKNMADNGDDLSRARAVNFSLVFSDREDADTFNITARERGWISEIESDEQFEMNEGHIEVVVTIDMIPTHHNITETENDLGTIAKNLGGRNDGWGCFSVPYAGAD